MQHDPNRPLISGEVKLLKKLEPFLKSHAATSVVRDGFGHSVVKVGKKTIVMIGSGVDGKTVGFSMKCDVDTQDFLIQSGDFIKTPYLGHHGWVSLVGEKLINKRFSDAIKLLEVAWLNAVPKKFLK